MKRDDDYILQMLKIINIFWTKCVIPKKVPPKDLYNGLRVHRQFLLRTRELAAECQVSCNISQAQAIIGCKDSRFFLDGNR